MTDTDRGVCMPELGYHGPAPPEGDRSVHECVHSVTASALNCGPGGVGHHGSLQILTDALPETA